MSDAAELDPLGGAGFEPLPVAQSNGGRQVGRQILQSHRALRLQHGKRGLADVAKLATAPAAGAKESPIVTAAKKSAAASL